MGEFRRVPCGRCHMKVVWGVDSTGKKIPLDPLAAVYRVEEREGGGVFVVRDKNCMVNHFATCPGVRKGKGD